MSNRVAAVIVTFNPDNELTARIALLIDQIGYLCIVDNGSDDAGVLDEVAAIFPDKVTVIKLPVNKGIGAALNIGLAQIQKSGFRLCVTFDQDSSVTEDFIKNLLATYDAKNSPDHVVAMVGANYRDNANRSNQKKFLVCSKYWFHRVRPDSDIEVTTLITSGCLVDIDIWNELGRVNEALFIDYVDTEFALRSIAAGYHLYLSYDAVIYHELGAKEVHKVAGVPIYPTNHSPLRRYYMARNAIYMYKNYAGKFVGWFLYDVAAVIYTLSTILFFERDKLQKFKMYLIGWKDGLLGRFGKYRKA
ncbi:glycosyltransferase family 2 protein [Orbaceae bacterium ESL0721]|nr:glycosyltransferase family 2 protein [Orbaceae bacterium ESL0721]